MHSLSRTNLFFSFCTGRADLDSGRDNNSSKSCSIFCFLLVLIRPFRHTIIILLNTASNFLAHFEWWKSINPWHSLIRCGIHIWCPLAFVFR